MPLHFLHLICIPWPSCAGTIQEPQAPAAPEPKAKSKAKAKAKAKSGAAGKVTEATAKTFDELKVEICAVLSSDQFHSLIFTAVCSFLCGFRTPIKPANPALWILRQRFEEGDQCG